MSYKGIFRAQENKEPIRNFEAEIDKINKELQPQVWIRVPYKNKNVYNEVRMLQGWPLRIHDTRQFPTLKNTFELYRRHYTCE